MVLKYLISPETATLFSILSILAWQASMGAGIVFESHVESVIRSPVSHTILTTTYFPTHGQGWLDAVQDQSFSDITSLQVISGSVNEETSNVNTIATTEKASRITTATAPATKYTVFQPLNSGVVSQSSAVLGVASKSQSTTIIATKQTSVQLQTLTNDYTTGTPCYTAVRTVVLTSTETYSQGAAVCSSANRKRTSKTMVFGCALLAAVMAANILLVL